MRQEDRVPMTPKNTSTSRRGLIATGTVAILVALIAPRTIRADPAAVAKEINRLYQNKTMASGKIRVDIPQIAENGLVVPVTIEVESPMTEQDYVRAVHIFADGNPLPNVASFYFTPACGVATASTRMRLAQTQNVICVAEMADGSLFTNKAEVKVTIGGCGG